MVATQNHQPKHHILTDDYWTLNKTFSTDGICLYDGTTTFSKMYLQTSANKFKRLSEKAMHLQPLKTSTLTVTSMFDNVSFDASICNESDFPEATGNIVRVVSDTIKKVNAQYVKQTYKHNTKRISRPKHVSARTSKVFGSGITVFCRSSRDPCVVVSKDKRDTLFETLSKTLSGDQLHNELQKKLRQDPANLFINASYTTKKKIHYVHQNDRTAAIQSLKIYPVKVFRNGSVQIPGVAWDDYSDMLNPLREVSEYMRKFCNNCRVLQKKETNDKPVDIRFAVSEMRNYSTCINLKWPCLSWEKLSVVISKYKSLDRTAPHANLLQQVTSKRKWFSTTQTYLQKFNELQIAEVFQPLNKSSEFVIKFYRPNAFKLNKKITMRIYKQGKVNIHGAFSRLEAEQVYYWLAYLLSKHYTQIQETEEFKPQTFESLKKNYFVMFDHMFVNNELPLQLQHIHKDFFLQ